MQRKKVLISISEDIYEFTKNIGIDIGIKSFSDIVEWLALNYLQNCYKPLDFEEEELKGILEAHGRKPRK